MSAKIGRNDRCHCGSGKKYKRCHLKLDAAALRPAPAVGAEEPPRPHSALSDIEQAVGLLGKVLKAGDEKQQEQVARLLARAASLKDYLSRKVDIDAATQALEPHRREFARFYEDKTALQARVEAVFAEDRFAPLRFTADDLQRAFDHAGSPLAVPTEKLAGHLRTCILHLADTQYRPWAAASLMVSLPDYVKAAQWMDGCLVMNCAYLTSNEHNEPNPFLWQMFVQGYQGWTAAKTARLGA